MSDDFISDKNVKILLYPDKKVSPRNSFKSDKEEKTEDKANNEEPITVTTRGFLPELKDTKITIEGSTSSTFSLSSDEDCFETSGIFTKNCIGIVQFSIVHR